MAVICFDAHAHCAAIADSDLPLMLERARLNGVGAIINTATNLVTAQRVLEQHALHSQLLPAIGISPFDVLALNSGWETALQALAHDSRTVAIGEIGIDTTNPRYPALSVQRPVFEFQLALARACNLPAVIHSRGAEAQALAMCIDCGINRAVFHCYTGSRAVLSDIVDKGYFVSFSGIITFGQNAVAELVRYVPLESVLVETDSPYLAPVPLRGKPNEPANAALVAGQVAALRGCTTAVLSLQLQKNFAALFQKATV